MNDNPKKPEFVSQFDEKVSKYVNKSLKDIAREQAKKREQTPIAGARG